MSFFDKHHNFKNKPSNRLIKKTSNMITFKKPLIAAICGMLSKGGCLKFWLLAY